MAEKGDWRHVFSTIKMVAEYILVLILLLSIALNNIVNGENTCVPVETPWTQMCQAVCGPKVKPTYVQLSDCNAPSLGEGSYSGGGSVKEVVFQSSITNVSRRAFFGYSLDKLHLIKSFVNFETESFEGLNVSYLSIRRNDRLTSLSMGVFRGVTGLATLKLSLNSIQSLHPGTFQGLTSLEWLTLSSNFLKSLPANIFQGLTRLKWLFLHNNDLKSVPENIFQGLTRLEWLFLDSNDLQSVPENIFQGLTGLEELDLNNNVLQSVPGNMLQGLTGLKAVKLHNNDLKSVPGNMLQGLNNLHSLSMYGNSISCLPLELLRPLRSLKQFDEESDFKFLCRQSFNDVGVNGTGLEVKDYNAKIDRCIVVCGESVESYGSYDSTCDCESYEGCLDCPTEDPVQPPITTADPMQPPITTKDPVQRPTPPTAGGVQAMKAASTGEMMLMVTPTAVMILVREFDF